MKTKNKVVYLHIKLDTGEPFYVGYGYLKRAYSKLRSRFWHNIVDKHGFDVIILEDNLTKEEAWEKETYWINRIGRSDLGKGPLVNHSDGGDKEYNRRPWNHTEEVKEKMRRPHSPEHIANNIASRKRNGKGLSEEARKKMSESHKGKKHSLETINKRKATRKRNQELKKENNEK